MSHTKWIRLVAFLLTAILLTSAITAAFATYDTITYGEQSDNVRKMQKALKSKGYYKGAVDGKFGPSTRKAVYKYQAAVGLTADGRPGNRTLTALYEGVSKLNKTANTALKQTLNVTNPRSLYYGCTGTRVRYLQQALRSAGYFKSSIDGVYGDLTLAAVKRYQRAKGLNADGIAGPQTIAKLNLSQNSVKVSNSMVLAVGSTGNEVKRLQQFLDSKNTSNTDAAGVFGQSTAAALKEWQEASGQKVTGTFSESDYNKYIIN